MVKINYGFEKRRKEMEKKRKKEEKLKAKAANKAAGISGAPVVEAEHHVDVEEGEPSAE